jgi:hypothetical protein
MLEWVTDREVLLGVHGADKVRTKDLHWSMGMNYDSRGLPGVSTVSLGVDGVLQLAPLQHEGSSL